MDAAQLFERFLALPPLLVYTAVFAAALLENLAPPLPGDAVVVIGGYLAGLGHVSLPLTFVLVTLGSWCGFMVYYAVGRWLGRNGVQRWLGRWLAPAALERSETWVRRHGLWMVLANRLLTGARAVISLTAGIAGLRAAPVALLALLSAALWNVVLVGGGYLVGEEWQRLLRWLAAYERAMLIALGVLGVALLLRAWRRRTRAQQAGRPAS